MNNEKTEIIVYGTSKQLKKVNIQSISVGGAQVNRVDSVRDLGVWMESNLSLDLHIRKKCQTAHHQLRNLSNIRNHLSNKSAEILVHELVLSHLDFCNGLFVDIPTYQLKRLQRIQNRSARIVTRTPYDRPILPVLKSLHWLPVQARIMFKIIVTVYKCLNGTSPDYLRSMLIAEQPSYSLRSTQGIMLKIPRMRTKLAERSFAFNGPKLWNALPAHMKDIQEEAVFRRQLKTFLFRQFYSE